MTDAPREESRMGYGDSNVVFTEAEYLAALDRFMKRRAARKAAGEIIARIVAGAPREAFGDFTMSFEEIERRTWKGFRPASGGGRERSFG
jgi:hypothetical protein